MRRSLVLLAAVALTTSATSLLAQTPSAADIAKAKRVLAATPLVDGHNDLPWRIREDKDMARDVERYDLRKKTPGHTDLARIKEGMLGAQFWSVYIPGERSDAAYAPQGTSASAPGYARVQLEQIEIARHVIAKYPEKLQWALTAGDVRKSFAQHKLGSLLGMEGGHAIENSLPLLRTFYDLGVRYMTLTHNVTLDWADAALDKPTHGGLTPFGKEVVREMNRLGMLVDLSHVSPGVMSSALDVAQAPVIFSHSGSRALVDHPRNVPDSILKRLPKNGGVVMVPFVTSFVSADAARWEQESSRQQQEIRQRMAADSAGARRAFGEWVAAHPKPKVTIAQVADVIDHIKQVAGVDHIGIGSDFDGIPDTVVGLEDVSKFPMVFAELARRGWSEADMRKVAGENVLRALAQAETVAKRLQKERRPSTATIQELDGKVAQ